MADPPASLLRWAAAAVGGDAVVSATALHDDGSSPWRLQVVTRDGTREAILRAAQDQAPWWRLMIGTGSAALRVAEHHGLAAPRLLACDLDGNEAGILASLETVFAGDSGWPWPEETSPERLRSAGAAIARVHRVPLHPRDELPLRIRPIEYDDFTLQRRWAAFYRASAEHERAEVIGAFLRFSGWPRAAAERMLALVRSSPLLHLADEVVRRYERPCPEPVFLHGDVWPGNMMFVGDTCVGLIDWKTAGVGDPGVDLGNLRFQMALRDAHDLEAARLVLDGWEEEIGRKATDVAYWDLVAALNTRTDFDAQEGVAGATQRRDAFVRAALENLGV